VDAAKAICTENKTAFENISLPGGKTLCHVEEII
jgi:hypothetical protein